MQVQQIRVGLLASYDECLDSLRTLAPHLLLVFASPQHFEQQTLFQALQTTFPGTTVLGCSTAGEICRDGAFEGHAMVTGLRFAHPCFRAASAALPTMDQSREAGQRLGQALCAPQGEAELHSVLLLGQGVQVNGSALVAGVFDAVDPQVRLSGALAGDGGAFEKTYTVLDGALSSAHVVALGFYGPGVVLTTASAGGWEPFGPVRHITRSQDNVLFELDGEPALDVYRRYLGDWAKDLPGSGLLFPFALLEADQSATGLIRTMLGMDEAQGSLTMAGEMPEGANVRLMHAGTSALVAGARHAAQAARSESVAPDLGILFSCVGRKLLMGGRVDEEVEVVSEVLGPSSLLTGFYSYGEIGSRHAFAECRLHNQTMTVTLLREGA